MTNKARGVYYTPSPVVDYIVRTTLGPVLEGKSPMQLAGRAENGQRDERLQPLTVLDPACGSGYFLLGVYQFLLDWCFAWYRRSDALRWSRGPWPTLRRQGAAWVLREEERRRILSDHIYGVDIDAAAIEIAKHSLRSLLPNRDSEPAPAIDLENIRCGNSLIGSDFDAASTGAESDYHLSTPVAFDWAVEFPAVMASGGFDAIVGNPPYVNARLVLQSQGALVKRYYRRRYRCARRAFDLYVLFVERSHELLRDGGRAGMILPNKIATLDYARPCRALLLAETSLDTITDVSGQQLFRDASVYPYIVTWTKQPPGANHSVRIVSAADAEDLSRTTVSHEIRQTSWSAATGIAIHRTLDVEARVTTQPLGRRCSIHSGTAGFTAERLASALREPAAASDNDAFDFIVSGNIDRYRISLGNVRFMKRKFVRPVLPRGSEVLTRNKRELFTHAKIVIAGMSRYLEAAWDPGGLALGVQVYALADFQDDPRFVLGLLNSKLMSYLLRTRFQAKRLASGYLAINKGQLAQLPIRTIVHTDRKAVAVRDEISGLVEQITQCNQPVEAIAARIDQLVYNLYRLTETEIEAVDLTVSVAPPRAR